MTKQEARAYVREAENLPPGEIDYDRLEEAVRVLGGDDPVVEAVKGLAELYAEGGLLVERGAVEGDVLKLDQVEETLRKVFSSLREWFSETEREDFRPALSAKGFEDEDAEALATASNILSRAAQGAVSEGYVPFQTGFEGAVTGFEGIGGQAPSVEAPAGIRGRAIEAAVAAGLSRPEAEQQVDAIAEQVKQTQAWAEETGQTPPPWMPSDLNVALEQQITVWEEEARALRGTPIGVPENFVAQRELPAANPAAFGSASVPSTVGVEPRYFQGDQFSLAGMSPEQIVEVQSRLEEAGLMEADSYYAGFWDSQSAQAYTSVLGWANQRGTTADEALNFLVSNVPDSVKEQRNAAKLAEQFQAPSFVKPDYATLAQDAKAYMRQRLGREPTEEEMRELTGEMSKAYRADFEAEVARQRAEFGAQRQGLETGEAVAPAAVQDVNPQARFRQAFESRFGPEIDRLAALPEVRENMNNVFASLRTMGSLVG